MEENIQIVEEFSKDELTIIFDSLGFLPVSINSPAFKMIFDIREKIKRKIELKNNNPQD